MKTRTNKLTGLILVLIAIAGLAANTFADEQTLTQQQRDELIRLLKAEGVETDLPASQPRHGAPTYKNPGTATLLSFLIPGGGQLYSGDAKKGLMQMGLAVVGTYLFLDNLPTEEWYASDYYWASYGYYYETGDATLSYGGLAVALGASIWSIIDASGSAQRANEANGFACGPFESVEFGLASVEVQGRTATGMQVAMNF